MKVTHILTIITLGLCNFTALADSFKSTKIEAQADAATAESLEEAESAVQAYLKGSKVWIAKEAWDAKNEIARTGIQGSESSSTFMCALEGRKDILTIKKNGSNQFIVSVLMEDKYSYETNEVEASIQDIEKIIRRHFDKVTKAIEKFNKELIAG